MRAADFEASDTGWQGASELLALMRAALGPERVVVVATLDYGELTPRDGVLLLHPGSSADYDELAAFLRAGGRLAILDDYGGAGKLLERFGIRKVPSPLRPERMLRQRADFAIATPTVPPAVAALEQARHPLVADVEELITNHPVALTHPNLTSVLEIRSQDEPPAALAVTGIILDKGRLLAMGDPSAVINLMLRYPGNRAFATALTRYLVDDDAWGERQGKVYLVANDFKQKGVFGGRHRWAAELRDQLDDAMGFASRLHHDGLPELLHWVLGGALALGAAGWVTRVAGRTYGRLQPRYAKSVPLLAQGGAAGRAAVLSASESPRALVLLELRSALLESLSERLGLGPSASREALLAEVVRQGALSAASSASLRAMLTTLDAAEAAVLHARELRLAPPQLLALERELHRLLAEAGAEHAS